ncbi:MAG: hypothetical protein P8M22_08485 [Phycisphaerales bacterium]|nr:hypothetical protein [Phycisphaerales bacterium]
MFSLTRFTRFHATFGVITLSFLSLLLVAGSGSKADELEVSCDSSFRRAMLLSAPVFAYEPAETALEHWSSLWSASSGLDDRTRHARRGLLLAAVEPMLQRATGDQCTVSIQRVRDQIEAELDLLGDYDRLPAEDVCDWIVLNRLLGENDRTRKWMEHRCDNSPMNYLPKRVRELVCMELADEIEWDESCDCLLKDS